MAMAAALSEWNFQPRTAQGIPVQLALQRLQLAGTLLPVGAQLVVRHVFQSAEKDPLEVIYAFVLPRDAALKSFRITGEGFSVQSELHPVIKAEQEYEHAIQDGHLASLLRGYRDGTVNLMVGNIRPGETVTACLEIAALHRLRARSLRIHGRLVPRAGESRPRGMPRGAGRNRPFWHSCL